MSCSRYRRQSPIIIELCPFVSIWHNVLNKLVSSSFILSPLPILLDTLLVTTHCHLSATYIMCRYSPQYRLCCRHHALLGSASTMFVYSNPSRHIQADNILPSLSRFNAYIYCTPLIPIISTGIQYLLFATAFAVDE